MFALFFCHCFSPGSRQKSDPYGARQEGEATGEKRKRRQTLFFDAGERWGERKQKKHGYGSLPVVTGV